MWTSVHRDDTRRVDHLSEKPHVSRSLEQLNVIVVRTGHHWWSGVEPQYAALAQTSVLRTGVSVSGFHESGLLLFPLGRVGRKPSIRRVHNQRRSPGPDDLCSLIQPELIVETDDARVRRRVKCRCDARPAFPSFSFCRRHFRFHVGHILVRQHLFPRELTGSFQRCEGGEPP